MRSFLSGALYLLAAIPISLLLVVVLYVAAGGAVLLAIACGIGMFFAPSSRPAPRVGNDPLVKIGPGREYTTTYRG